MIKQIPAVIPVLVILSKQSLLNWRCPFKRGLNSCCSYFSSLPQDESPLFGAGFSSPTTLIFSRRSLSSCLEFFSSASLPVFYCDCPTLLEGELLHSDEISFPTQQRVTHAINLSCIFWLLLRLPMEVSWQIRWGGKLKTCSPTSCPPDTKSWSARTLAAPCPSWFSHCIHTGRGLSPHTTGSVTCTLVF